MTAGLKNLIVITCVLVIGAIGYFAWKEVSSGIRRSERTVALQERDRCLLARDRSYRGVTGASDEVRACIRNGILRTGDL